MTRMAFLGLTALCASACFSFDSGDDDGCSTGFSNDECQFDVDCGASAICEAQPGGSVLRCVEADRCTRDAECDEPAKCVTRDLHAQEHPFTEPGRFCLCLNDLPCGTTSTTASMSSTSTGGGFGGHGGAGGHGGTDAGGTDAGGAGGIGGGS